MALSNRTKKLFFRKFHTNICTSTNSNTNYYGRASFRSCFNNRVNNKLFHSLQSLTWGEHSQLTNIFRSPTFGEGSYLQILSFYNLPINPRNIPTCIVTRVFVKQQVYSVWSQRDFLGTSSDCIIEYLRNFSNQWEF